MWESVSCQNMIHKRTENSTRTSHVCTHTYSHLRKYEQKQCRKSQAILQWSFYPKSNLVVNETCGKHWLKDLWIPPTGKKGEIIPSWKLKGCETLIWLTSRCLWEVKHLADSLGSLNLLKPHTTTVNSVLQLAERERILATLHDGQHQTVMPSRTRNTQYRSWGYLERSEHSDHSSSLIHST